MSATPTMQQQARLMQVILAPVVSEKSTFVADKRDQVIFRVTKDATKPDIKRPSNSCSKSRWIPCRSPT